jgi:CBS domain-containing protein
MQTCRDVMTKDVIWCLPKDSVLMAAQLMKENDIGFIPVIEDQENKKVVGVVTDRDLALQVLAELQDPNITKVEDIMTTRVVTCQAEVNASEAVEIMSQYQLRRIPVLDSEHKIVGVISQSDVATRTDQPGKTAEMLKEISRPNMLTHQP